MYDSETKSVRKRNVFSLVLSTPVGTGTGTDDYNTLLNQPSINGYTLSGNVTLANLGLAGVPLAALTIAELTEIIGGD